MLVVPRTIHLAHGAAEGLTPLNAFDNALAEAGIHDLNLIRVSSIVPEGAGFGELPPLPVGTVVPAVYSKVTSNVPGEVIAACIGAGIGSKGGVLMEYQHAGPADDAERVTQAMVEEGFRRRGWELDRVLFATAEHKVDRLGCAVAAAVFLDGVPVDKERG
jgi:arginine decarboxylase